MEYKILILEDEINLGMTLFEYLKSHGHTCELANSIRSAEHCIFQKKFIPHIGLFDIGLPDGNGLEFASQIKSQFPQMVLFFLSAQNDPQIRVEGLEIGAEDYITKPFNLKELTLRLNRVLHYLKAQEHLPEEISHGKLQIWFKRYELKDAHQNVIRLGQKECAILELLYQRKNQAVTREEMINCIWGIESYPGQRTIDNYIVKLRKWCETDPNQAIEIHSIRGVGYKLSINE